MVHGLILRRSPVLACMTTSSFSEGIRKEIVLPEDDEDTFGRILEHLYDNDERAFDVTFHSPRRFADKLATMYAMAEKYELTGLKVRIVKELEECEPLIIDPNFFFETARQIWQNISDSDQIFQAYFREQALVHLKDIRVEEVEELSDMVDSGGSFARKLVQLQAELYHENRLTWLSQVASLNEELTLAKKQLQSNKAGAEAGLASTKAGLASTHSRLGTTGGYGGYGGYGQRDMEGRQTSWW